MSPARSNWRSRGPDDNRLWLLLLTGLFPQQFAPLDHVKEFSPVGPEPLVSVPFPSQPSDSPDLRSIYLRKLCGHTSRDVCLAEKAQINLQVDPEQKARWEAYIEESERFVTLPILIRTSVEAHIQDDQPETAAPSPAIASDVQDLQEELTDVRHNVVDA